MMIFHDDTDDRDGPYGDLMMYDDDNTNDDDENYTNNIIILNICFI